MVVSQDKPMDSESFVSEPFRTRALGGDACTELVRLYENEVRHFIRYRLNGPKMRRFLDSVDVCQSVFAKFFVRVGHQGIFNWKVPCNSNVFS